MGMTDDNEVRLKTRMDVAFCARLLAAIEAGLESAPIGVVRTPNSLGDMEPSPRRFQPTWTVEETGVSIIGFPVAALANLRDAPKREQGRDDKASPRYTHGYVLGANSDLPSIDYHHEVHDCHDGENQHRNCGIRVRHLVLSSTRRFQPS